FTPGLEAAGLVTGCGPGVTRVRPGDRVVALLDHGAFAEQAIARETDVFPFPAEMDFATAAGFAIAYGTSYGALRWRADLRPGEGLGATVIATAGGPDQLSVAAAHGADHLIDYRQEDIRTRVKEILDGGGVDVVYDPVGGAAFDASLRCVNWGARLVTIGFASG